MNKCFQSVFTQNTYSATTPKKQNPVQQHSILQKEIGKALEQLATDKAKRPDKLGNALLKNFETFVPKKLHLIINLTTRKAQISSNWEVSKSIPILEDGNKQDVSHYRSISRLSAISKLLDDMIIKKLTPLIYPIQNSSQHGFRPE